MYGLNILAPCQIRNRTREFKNAMISTRRQIELCHCRAHQTLPLILQLVKLPFLPDTHVGIADDVAGFPICKAFILNITRSLYASANGL